jgi:hypothetical protein
MAKQVFDLGSLEPGDQIKLGGVKYDITGIDQPWVSNAAMRTQSITIHFKDAGYSGLKAPEDYRGTAEQQQALQNDPTVREPQVQRPLVFKDGDKVIEVDARPDELKDHDRATGEGMPNG